MDIVSNFFGIFSITSLDSALEPESTKNIIRNTKQ